MKLYTAASRNMPNPRDFFENIVKPSYEAWLADHLREWKAKAATSNADTMAERIFVYWNNRDQTHVAGARNPREYRTHLRTNVCPDFGLVWDVHDGHKHATLNRPNRQVTNAGQTGVRHMTYGQVAYNEGVYGGGAEIVIGLDNGSRRELRLVMQNVMAMWEKLLVDMGL
jgi:hypothetical protein